MEHTTSYRPLVKKLFWRASLPLIFLSSAWCLIRGINPLESHLFIVALLTTVPMMCINMEEQQERTVESIASDFRKMGATEFLNFMNEFKKIPLGRFRATYKEACCRVYMERYGRDIFAHIPGFGTP